MVENVVRSLNLLLLGDTRLFQKVGLNVTTAEFARRGEVNPNEFTKSRGVVIPRGFGITIGFQNRIGGNNLVLKGYFLSSRSFFRCSNSCQVGNDLLGVFSFSSTRLSSDQHGLILGIGQHVTVGSLSNSPQVRGNLVSPLSKVHLDNSSSVDGVPLVGVHHNTEETRVSVDELSLEANLQVVEDRGIVQESQVSHVFALLEFGRIDLTDFRRFEGFFLS